MVSSLYNGSCLLPAMDGLLKQRSTVFGTPASLSPTETPETRDHQNLKTLPPRSAQPPSPKPLPHTPERKGAPPGQIGTRLPLPVHYGCGCLGTVNCYR